MKRYKASDLSHKRAEVIKEAKANGVVIECRNTNGEVVNELLLIKNESSSLMPNFNNAPDWAKYLTANKGQGDWTFWENKPEYNSQYGEWFASGKYEEHYTGLSVSYDDAKSSLVERICDE